MNVRAPGLLVALARLALSSVRLTSSEMAVLHALAARANGNGVCWPSMQTLALDSRLSERTVRTTIDRLKQPVFGRQILSVTYRRGEGGRQGSCLFMLHADAIVELAEAFPRLQPLQSGDSSSMQSLPAGADSSMQPLHAGPNSRLQNLQLQTATIADKQAKEQANGEEDPHRAGARATTSSGREERAAFPIADHSPSHDDGPESTSSVSDEPNSASIEIGTSERRSGRCAQETHDRAWPRPHHVRRAEQAFTVGAFVEGVRNVTGAPHVVPRHELASLDDAVDAYLPEGLRVAHRSSERDKWLRESAATYRKSIAGFETLPIWSGASAKGFLKWLSMGRPDRDRLTLSPRELEAQVAKERERERVAERAKTVRKKEREEDAAIGSDEEQLRGASSVAAVLGLPMPIAKHLKDQQLPKDSYVPSPGFELKRAAR